ncbi:MAG: lipid-A-disaccharide synthase [Lentisphaeria bacterium]|nr:lipid-A-disaccharide synthase [Lentisphaeria bacterium]
MTGTDTVKKVWIFAGEASGDLYGAALAKSLWAQNPDLKIAAMGAQSLKAAGVEILVDSSELGIVGFVEVLKHLPMFKRIFRELVEKAEKERPDAIILIDYPGFNLRFAKEMKKRRIKILYYITPQVWAWGKKRIPEIAETVEHMMVIFPFEKDIYKDYDLKTTFVGHPMIQLLHEESSTQRDEQLILLLPGSRRSEISRLLKPMLETAEILMKEKPEFRFIIPAPNDRIADYIRKLKISLGKESLPIDIIPDKTAELMRSACAGIAASGTVTIQAAILGLPLVVVYKINSLSYIISKLLIKIPYFTMVNLVAEKKVFEEFLQSDVNPSILNPALKRILPDGERCSEVAEGIEECIKRLQAETNASDEAAKVVLSEI